MNTGFNAALVDDDSLIRLSWEYAARKHGIRLLTAANPDELLRLASDLPKTAPIYIDVKLGANMRGEIVAEQLSALGFRELYLTTGYPAASLEKPACVRAILSKDPPWN